MVTKTELLNRLKKAYIEKNENQKAFEILMKMKEKGELKGYVLVLK